MLTTAHLQLGLNFVHTHSVALPAAGLSLTPKVVFQNSHGGKPVSFSTLYNIQMTMHLTLMEWLTIETGSWWLTQLTYPLFIFFLPTWLPIPYHDGLPSRVGLYMILARLPLPLSCSLSQFASGTVAKMSLNICICMSHTTQIWKMTDVYRSGNAQHWFFAHLVEQKLE